MTYVASWCILIIRPKIKKITPGGSPQARKAKTKCFRMIACPRGDKRKEVINLAEARRPIKEKCRDKAMFALLTIRDTTWDMIETYPEKDRDKIADEFDKVLKALQEAIIEL